MIDFGVCLEFPILATETSHVKEKLTIYSERETAVEDDRTRFAVCAGFRVSGCACVAS